MSPHTCIKTISLIKLTFQTFTLFCFVSFFEGKFLKLNLGRAQCKTHHNNKRNMCSNENDA